VAFDAAIKEQGRQRCKTLQINKRKDYLYSSSIINCYLHL